MTGERTTPFTPREVAAMFNVTSKTVTRWADSGLLLSFRTPGSHRRFTPAAVAAFRAEHMEGST